MNVPTLINIILSCPSEVRAEMLMFFTSIIIFISVTFPHIESVFSLMFRNRNIIFSDKYANLYLSMGYTLFLPLMSYVFSQAKYYDLDAREQVILFWMVLIEIIRVRSGNYSSWELRKSAEQLVRLFWVGYLVYSYAPIRGIMVSLFYLCIYSAFSEILKAIMINKAKESYLIGKNPKLIDNYVKRIMLHEDLQTTPMNICDYIVLGEENYEIHICSNGYLLGEKKASSSRGMLTIARVFQLISSDDEAFTSAFPNWRDHCLSLALAKMLRRRFAKLVPINEAGCRKALDFVLEGLIDGKPADRVFNIIQEEVKLVSDFLNIKIPVYYYYNWYIIVDLIGVFIMSVIGLYILVRSLWQSLVDREGYIHCISMLPNYRYGYVVVDFFLLIDLTITFCLIVSSAYMITATFIMGFRERWFNLINIRIYIKDPAKWKKSYILLLTKPLLDLANYLKEVFPNKKERVYSSVLDVSILARLPKVIQRNIPRKSHTIVHSTDAKDAILSSLRNSGGYLTNGETSLKKYGMENLNWACQPNVSSTEAILVWHIATTLFHNQNPSPQQNNNPVKEQEVALALSSYCHYLVKSFPELLPDEVDWTEHTYESVIKEILAIHCCWMPCRADRVRKTRCNYAMYAMWVQSSIVGKGAMLAKDLMNYAKDEKQVWNMLAEFWAEMILFIAPSDNVEGHQKILDQKEIITQLWALLTHAGIVTRPRHTEHQDHQSERNAVSGDMKV